MRFLKIAAIGAASVLLTTAALCSRPVRRWIIARALRRVLREERQAAKAREAGRAIRLAFGDTMISVEAGRISVPSDALSSAPTLPPGRQAIRIPGHMVREGMFGRMVAWSPPFPRGARNAAWSDLHRFAPGARDRQKSPGARFITEEPPIALICVGCELEQPPLEDERACPYCGIHMKAHGSRVFWWRDAVEVAEWTPRR